MKLIRCSYLQLKVHMLNLTYFADTSLFPQIGSGIQSEAFPSAPFLSVPLRTSHIVTHVVSRCLLPHGKHANRALSFYSIIRMSEAWKRSDLLHNHTEFTVTDTSQPKTDPQLKWDLFEPFLASIFVLEENRIDLWRCF